jgi:glutamyl-Q tRNA(Asp) synthetase
VTRLATSALRRGRFAPSPTGPLHFGSLVAALASACDARHDGGEWLLRIEDVDLPRARPGAEAAILRALEAYGFTWDGPVLRQSTREAVYRDALDVLRARGEVFACACSRRELEAAPPGRGGERVYPGTCRQGVPDALAGRGQRALRLALRHDGEARVEFRDRLQGPQCQDLVTEVGDFVLQRADGLAAYQLAVVVDDAAQGVTDVVRGADLLASTPRQIYLQRRLGYPTPVYLHVPVAVDAAGLKLSKQTLAAPLPALPLPALLAAWRFLDQPLPAGSACPASPAEFWRHAVDAWNPRRLPPTPMLPAPPDYAADRGRGPAL